MTFVRNLDFFSISQCNKNFPSIIKIIENLPRSNKPEGKILEGDGYAIALTEFLDTTDSCEGIIVRLRTEDIPVKGNLIENIFSKIPLSKNEGLAEMTFFFYSKDLNILCLLPAKNGVKWGTFAHYINQKCPDLENFNLELLLSVDALKVFRNFKSVTSVIADLKIGSDSKPKSKEVQKLPLGMVIDSEDRSGATRIKIELYNPKLKGGLIPNTAKKVSEIFRKLSGDVDTEHLIVRGSQGADYSDQVVDLISQRYKIPVRLGKSGGRHLDFDECRKIVRKKFKENEETIKQVIG